NRARFSAGFDRIYISLSCPPKTNHLSLLVYFACLSFLLYLHRQAVRRRTSTHPSTSLRLQQKTWLGSTQFPTYVYFLQPQQQQVDDKLTAIGSLSPVRSRKTLLQHPIRYDGAGLRYLDI
ncbi:unnamed protein product, partial [Ectocarpus sp. 8 AP-2014]